MAQTVLLPNGKRVNRFEYREQLEKEGKYGKQEAKAEVNEQVQADAPEAEAPKSDVKKPISKMNLKELKGIALELGASEGSLEGQSKAQVKEIIAKLEEAPAEVNEDEL